MVDPILAEIIACPVCKEWLAYCMVAPIRCPGLTYARDGTPITPSGRIWSEVVAEHQAEEHDARLEYWRKNKDHIIRHENERAERYKSRIEPAHHQEQS
jgi:uncharacterized protein YbaR (Trm112 family)